MRSPFLLLTLAVHACGGGSTPDAQIGPDARTADAPLAIDAAPGGPDARPADARTGDAPLADGPLTGPDARVPDGLVAIDAPGGIDASPNLPTLTNVTIEGYGASVQVSQGNFVVITAHGTHLGNVIYGVIGTDMIFASNSTATDVTFTDYQVGHGAAIGPRSLRVVGSDGETTLPAALTVTAIVAQPGGDDAGHGTYDSPYATASHAMFEGHDGDTVRLLAGTYQDGEDTNPRVVAGLSVIGDGSDKTNLVGKNGYTGVIVEHGGSITGLRIANYTSAVLDAYCLFDDDSTSTGDTVLNDVILDSCETGLYLRWSAVLTNVVSVHNIGGVQLLPPDAASFTITGLDVTNAGTGLVLGGKANATMTGCNLHGNQEVGLEVVVHAQVTMRDSTIAQPNAVVGHFGVVIDSDGAVLDFGHAGASGGNTISAAYLALDDQRPARAAADGPIITMTGTTVNGMTFPAGTKTVGIGGHFPEWEVEHGNNRLAFEPATW